MCEKCTQGIEKAIEYGKAYGYPDCCIADWISRRHFVENKIEGYGMTVNQWNYVNAINDYSYIPCDKCSIKLLDQLKK